MRKVFYHIGRLTEDEQNRLDIKDSLSRTMDERIELGLVPLKFAILSEKPYRIFNSTAEYRNWADKNLSKYLGYNICYDK